MPAAADVPTLAAPINDLMHDRVSNTRIEPHLDRAGGRDMRIEVELSVAAQVLGGLASSRLDRILVRDEQSAVTVNSFLLPFQRVSYFGIVVDVKPGEDPQAVTNRLDQIVADFIANGPTEDEIQRVATTQIAQSVFAIEQIGGFTGKAWCSPMGDDDRRSGLFPRQSA